MKTLHNTVVIGATGDVGRGITVELLRAGSQVLAVARDAQKLAALQSEFGSYGKLQTLQGDVSTPELASRLQQAVAARAHPLSAVITSVNAPLQPAPLATLDAEAVLATMQANVLPHLNAARAFIPTMAEGSCFLSMGGGMADWVEPGFAGISMCQAAQRMLLRHIANDYAASGVTVRELMLHSMINGASRRHDAQAAWLTDEEVGRHVCFVLQQPQLFGEVVINLRSRKQVAQAPAVRT